MIAIESCMLQVELLGYLLHFVNKTLHSPYIHCRAAEILSLLKNAPGQSQITQSHCIIAQSVKQLPEQLE